MNSLQKFTLPNFFEIYEEFDYETDKIISNKQKLYDLYRQNNQSVDFIDKILDVKYLIKPVPA